MIIVSSPVLASCSGVVIDVLGERVDRLFVFVVVVTMVFVLSPFASQDSRLFTFGASE